MKMHYWREDYFETLRKAAADAVCESPGWQDYADFCLDYERGLRSQAFLTLGRFISRIEHEPLRERRRFVSWLMRASDEQKDDHMLVPHPLRVRIVEPTLLEWTMADPQNSGPHRWIGGREYWGKPVDAIQRTALLCVSSSSIF